MGTATKRPAKTAPAKSKKPAKGAKNIIKMKDIIKMKGAKHPAKPSTKKQTATKPYKGAQRGRKAVEPNGPRGRKIFSAIRAKKMTLRLACAKLGTSYPTLSRVLHDEKKRMRPELAAAITKHLGIPVRV